MTFNWPGRDLKRLGTDLRAVEFRRLGKPGAYRLGLLRRQGVSERRQPMPFRARFARRPEHRWPAYVWLLIMLAGVVLIAAGTAVGWWFVPTLVGLGAGLANAAAGWPPRVALPAVVATAAVGWIAPFLAGSASASMGGALARAIGTAAGLPVTAAGVVALTGLIAVVQALSGYCLASAVMPLLLGDEIR